MTDDPTTREPAAQQALEPGADQRPPVVDRLLLAITAVAVVLGVVLRFLPRAGMWLDEALTANISSLPLGELGRRTAP